MRRAVHDRLAGERVDSRWWYWVAAIPATFTFWIVTVAWVAIAVGLGRVGRPDPVVQSGEISLVAFGVPFLVLTIVFPFAVYADATAILRTDVGWRPQRVPIVTAAAFGPSLAFSTGMMDLLADGSLDVPGWAVVAGFLLAVPVATYYLHRRHEHLGVP